jgi:hypothetical protein
MPDAVYHQTLWAVRDLTRMENRLTEIVEADHTRRGKSIVYDHNYFVMYDSSTERLAMERVILEERIWAIRDAMDGVPEIYRNMIMDDIVSTTARKQGDSKVWKYWKQRFLYRVAKNMSMI